MAIKIFAIVCFVLAIIGCIAFLAQLVYWLIDVSKYHGSRLDEYDNK